MMLVIGIAIGSVIGGFVVAGLLIAALASAVAKGLGW